MLEKDIEMTSGSLVVEPMVDAPHRFKHLCSECGEHIYTTASNHPATALFRAGLLEDPREVEIDAHIFVKRKRSWLVLPDDVPQFDTFYDREKDWPEESLARLERAIGKST